MSATDKLCENYRTIENSLRFLSSNFSKQPSLKELASHAAMSEFHFHRVFTRWVGISPKKFIQYLTLESIKKNLDDSRSLFNVSLDAGLSSPSRLHDLFVSFEGMTPGEYRARAADLRISYGFVPSPFGEILLATTGNGICGLSFIQVEGRDAAVKALQKHWPKSIIVQDRRAVASHETRIQTNFQTLTSDPGYLLLKGTAFQIKVWEALLMIPAGTLVSYKNIALMLGMPDSARAVANAIAANPIAFIIPCHRVIHSTGMLGGYRWGVERKQALIGWEAEKVGVGQ